jgi:ribonuclease HI
MFTLWFDGLFQRVSIKASQPSEAGLMGYGWLILKNNLIVAKGQGVFARGKGATSGVAEYLALIEGLDALSDLCGQGVAVEIRGDAKFIIDQMTGASDVTSESIKPLHRQVKDLIRFIAPIHWVWTPRRQNRRADELSRHALSHLLRSPSYYTSAIETITRDASRRRNHGSFLSLVDLRIYQSNGI